MIALLDSGFRPRGSVGVEMDVNPVLSRTRIKICGLRRPDEAIAAAALGVDAVGLNFYEPSPRYVERDAACEIVAALPPFVTAVGLFVDASPEQIERTLERVPLGALQFHGAEDYETCARWGLPFVKAVAVRDDTDVPSLLAHWVDASGVQLDAYRPGVPGGTGERFDWKRIPPVRPLPLVLAGGLDARNVGEAVRTVRPQAVDVCGGVERVRGVKDMERMTAFVEAVACADAEVAAGKYDTGIAEQEESAS